MTRNRSVLRLVLLYAVLGIAWTVFAERILLALAPDGLVLSHLEVWNGVIFVIFSAGFLFLAAGGLREPEPDAGQDGVPRGAGALVLVFTAFAAAIVLTGLGGVARTADKQREKEIERLQSIADLKVRQISLWLGERLADARVVRNDDSLFEAYADWKRTGEDRHRRRLLERLRMHGATGDYPVVTLLDEAGRVVLQSEGEADEEPPLREAALRALATGEVISSDLYGAAAGHPSHPHGVHLDLVAPLRGGRDGVRAAVALRIDPNRFLYPYIQTWPVPSASAETLLFRGEGDHVLFLNELRHRSNTALKLRVPFDRGADLLAVQVLMGRAKPGEPVEGRDYRDVPVLGVVKSVPGTPWFMVAKLDKAELYAPTRGDAAWIAVAEILALAVAAVAITLIHQRRELRHARLRRQEQEEKLRALQLLNAVAESSTDSIFAKDTEGRYILVNRELSRQTGKTREEILGRNDRELFAQEDADRLVALDRQVLAGDHPITAEETLTTPGGRRTFQSTKGPLFDTAGNAIGLFGVARDITEHKFQERELRAGEARYRAVFDAVSDAVSLHDAATGAIIEANDRFVRLFGYSRNEARNLEIGDLGGDHPPHTRDWLRGWFRRAGRGEAADFEWQARRRDGRLFPVEVRMRRTEVAGHACVLVLMRSLEDAARTTFSEGGRAQPA
ncbi:MAG: PAS domain S-box protein [Rhodocyclaceae bacterium]|nr:PAS domain S-box protein [Rhodocyclaceae bacterium]